MEDYKGKDQKQQRYDRAGGNSGGGDRNRTSDLSSFVFGKVQPQALQLEEAVLGALMLDKDALPAVMDILRPESFYTEANQAIYRAITGLFRGSKPIDLLTVTEELRKMGAIETIGGSYHLVELTNRVGSAANIEYHARIISQKHIQRELIKVSTTIIRDAYEDSTDVFDLLDKAEQSLFSITETNLSRSFEGMNTLAGKLLKQIELLSQKKDGLTGVPTGFTDLDRLTSGWQPSDLVIVAARPSMGKCLAKGTKVMLFDGTLKNVEDINVDDLLMGDDSTPRRVLSLARGREQMYWVRQKHGVDYRVNESHILSLKRSRNEGKNRHGDVENIEVKEYLKKSAKWKTNYKGYKVGVEFADTPLSIEPYFMGLWLGDGKTESSRIYTQDKEIVDYLTNYADRLDARLSVMDEHRCPGYTIARVFGKDAPMDSVQGELRRLGVLGNKHIPKSYLLNSRKNRLELLAGLIDSDGFLNEGHGGTYEITSKHELLARQIKYLCDTLGYRTSINSKIAKITSIGYESTVWRVRFNGNVDEIPVRLPRKKGKKWSDRRDWQVTGITVEADIVDDYYGFEIDGNHLFLLGDCTVTHNTAFTLSLARNAAMEFGKGVALFSLEMSNLQLVQRLVSMESEVGSSKLRTGQLEPHEWQQLHTAIERMSKAPIFIDDTPGINVFELRAKCRRLKAQHDIQLIIIDYLQLMTAGTEGGRGGNREQEISSISRALKGLAKELNVPVIALSQLSRAVETRGGSKKPQLSDLRECVTGDTLIYMPETGEYCTVKSLLGKSGFKVLALDKKTMKLTPSVCLDVWATGEKEIFEVETQSGMKIRTSLNHPFLTVRGWQQLVDLHEGDMIATARQLPNVKGVDLADDEILLLAHLIGDGCFVDRQPIHYTSQDEASLTAVENAAKNLWQINTRRVADVHSENCWQLYLPSPYHLTHGKHHPFVLLLKKVGLEKARSHEKTVPPMLFNANNKQISLFLHHLWATDGGVHIRTEGSSKIHYSSNSFELVKGVQSLLLRFGIRGVIQKTQKADYKSQYILNITGKEDLLRFIDNIGIFGQKSIAIAQLRENLSDVVYNPNADVIDREIWNTIRNRRKESGFTERSFQAAIGTQYCGTSLYRSNISRERLGRVADVLEATDLQYLAESDVRWEKIKSITHIGNEMTYDLHVENTHNFVAENFIIHNSGAIEQDADIVSFIYRPEYYQILEDENGNSTKGMATIIVSKHRNGALGEVNLRFVGEFSKFADPDDYGFNNLAAGTVDVNSPQANVIRLSSRMNDDDIAPPQVVQNHPHNPPHQGHGNSEDIPF